MRAAAEIDKGAVAIQRNLLARLGKALDEMHLHEVVVGRKAAQPSFPRLPLADKALIAGYHLAILSSMAFRSSGVNGVGR